MLFRSLSVIAILLLPGALPATQRLIEWPHEVHASQSLSGPRCWLIIEKEGALELHWKPVPGQPSVTGYRLYRNTSIDGPYLYLDTVNVPGEWYQDTGTTNGTRYFYIITSITSTNQESTVNYGLSAVPHSLNDTDFDSLPDDWELGWFGDLSQRDLDDYDNDGVSNLQEYTLGMTTSTSRSEEHTSELQSH